MNALYVNRTNQRMTARHEGVIRQCLLCGNPIIKANDRLADLRIKAQTAGAWTYQSQHLSWKCAINNANLDSMAFFQCERLPQAFFEFGGTVEFFSVERRLHSFATEPEG